MIEPGFVEQSLDRGAPPRHFGVAEKRGYSASWMARRCGGSAIAAGS